MTESETSSAVSSQPVMAVPTVSVQQPTVAVTAPQPTVAKPQQTVTEKQPTTKQIAKRAAKPPQVKDASKPAHPLRGSFVPIAPKETPVKLKHVAVPKLENTPDDATTLEKEEDRLLRIINNRFGGMSASVLNAKKKEEEEKRRFMYEDKKKGCEACTCRRKTKARKET